MERHCWVISLVSLWEINEAEVGHLSKNQSRATCKNPFHFFFLTWSGRSVCDFILFPFIQFSMQSVITDFGTNQHKFLIIDVENLSFKWFHKCFCSCIAAISQPVKQTILQAKFFKIYLHFSNFFLNWKFYIILLLKSFRKGINWCIKKTIIIYLDSKHFENNSFNFT